VAGTVSAQPAVYKLPDLLDRLRNPDTLYVVNFWATWCKPCVKELPSFDSLQHSNEGKAIRVLLVSLDFAEDLHKRLVPFLRDRAVKSECLLLDEPDGNTFINAIHPGWSGAIPATLVRKGDITIFEERSLNARDLAMLCEQVSRK
jgi:thiol-disulfide isomerase/thioredoxin